MNDVRIEARDVVLCEFVEDDWPAVHRYASDPRVVEFEAWGPNSEDESRKFVARCMRAQMEEPRRTFELAVMTREADVLIGGAALRVVGEAVAEIGYALAREYWGKGLGTQVAGALIRFGLEELRMHRISATCHSGNVASARVMEKAGMQREGLLRHNRLQRGVWCDSLVYAILADDASPSEPRRSMRPCQGRPCRAGAKLGGSSGRKRGRG